MARICKFSCFILDRERYDAWQKSRNCSCRRKKALKILETGATACHFAMLLRVSRGRFNCSPRIFLNRGWLPREIDPDGYSEIVRAQWDVFEDHQCVEYFLTLIHSILAALNPIAAFF